MAMKAAVVFVLLVALAARAVHGANIIVGGNSGWTQGFDYDTWAAGQTFALGDALVFNYGGSHSVDEVNEASYTACSSSSVIKSHTGGATSIPLSTPGPKYFLCPTLGHCSSGMKLQINVLAANNSTPTPPASANPSPTPPAINTPPPPPPSPSAAPTTFFNLNHLIFGASIVYFAAMFVL